MYIKEHKINILGVNTHRHAALDWVTKPGYKDYYVYCVCSEENKTILSDQLEYPEFIGDVTS